MAKYIINADIEKSRIDKNIYGNFSEHLGRCVYEGMFVGKDSDIPNVNGMRTDVVEALREMRLPILRWPGGCFADTYHWMDGVGPQENRSKIVNVHWGFTTEDNSFGTHEFMEFCRQVGCEPYICGNLGSGTVKEMSDWVDYINNDSLSPMSELRRKNGQDSAWTVKYWGVGNENWGCGGTMRPQYYADEYKRYACYLRDYGGKPVFKIACGPYNDYYEWTEVLMSQAAPYMNGLALHYYCGSGNGTSTEFGEKEWYTNIAAAQKIDEYITLHSAIMDRYDPEKRVALFVDEWGTWYPVEPGTNPHFLYQQSTVKDALIAGTTLNIFNKHADRVQGANIAQLINVLQSVILTDGAKMVKTPTYYVFKMYADHQDATLLDSWLENSKIEYDGGTLDKLSESVSRLADGRVCVTLCNLDMNKGESISCALRGMKASSLTAEIIQAEDAHDINDFDQAEKVVARPFDGARLTADGFAVDLPARCVVKLILK